jgi:predicted esterase
MEKIYVLAFVVLVSSISYGQNKDTVNISITNYKLHPGTYSWRGDNAYYDMTSWDSSPYLEGHLKQGSQFKLNYRMLMPLSYNEQYDPGYPLIIMFHGAGERGNCWTDNCYCPDPAQCNPNNTPIPGTDTKFLNNDHNLAHGGLPHLNARNLAQGKLPNDPTLQAKAFPGFVIFPQMTNQWRNQGSPANSDVSHAVRIVRLLCRQYNIDENRIYIHGLSMGGQGMLEALNYADWLFAAAAPMSPINFQQNLEYDSVKNIPLWIFQGGKDLNPKPSQTEGMITNLRAKGANVRYTLYPHLGHGTWNTAYAEPDFFSWLLSFNKANIHVDFNNPNICETTSVGAHLNLAQGFPAYQWEFNGQIIAGATTHTYVAIAPGVYRARFSRKSSSPTEAEWNRWSDPVTVGKKSPEAPDIEQIGTLVLSDLNVNNTAQLKVPDDYVKYTWFQNGQAPAKALVQNPASPEIFTHSGCTGGGPCPHSGAYTLVTEGFDQCPSIPSKPKHLVFGTHNTTLVPPAISGTPNAFTYEIKSPTSILLKWKDNSQNERGFEIWRRKLLNIAGEQFTEGWVLATLTAEDVTMFLDKGVEPNSTYYYKIRAVNNTGRSHYFPNNSQGNVNHNLIINTPSELVPPTPPMNLIAKLVGFDAIELTWSPSTDESPIRQYHIYYGTESIATGTSDTTYRITGLPSNTVFNFTAKAEDPAGNLSEESNPAHAHTFVSGLYYKHSTGAWNNMSEMTSTWANPEYTGWVSSFTLQERTQDDYFNFEFSGFLFITTPGNYTFRLTSDDGSQLLLNDVMIVDHDGLHGNTTKTGTAQALSAGAIPILVRYFEATGGQSLTVQYNGPDTNNSWATIPASALKSGNAPALPVPPAAPTNLVATATGPQSVSLIWEHSESLNFELQRAGSLTGPFTTITKTNQKTFNDPALIPNHLYFYRVRAVSSDTVSQFSSTAFATTQSDSEAPGQPGTPVFHQQNFSTVSFTWTASTDNIAVAGYEVYANGILIGMSETNAYQVTGLATDENYTFTIVGFDQNGNKSIPSAGQTMFAQAGITFYTQPGGGALNDLNAWRSSGGAIPPGFNYSGQTFVVQHALPLLTNWEVEGTNSKIVVASGVTVTLGQAVSGRLDAEGTASITLAHPTMPTLGTLSATSTINYVVNNATAIPAVNFGNLGLLGQTEYVFPSGLTNVQGDFTVSTGTAILGAAGNASQIKVGGEVSFDGSLASVDPASRIGLIVESSGTQMLTLGDDLELFEIKKLGSGTLSINTTAPVSIKLGSGNGGGLLISEGVFSMGNNSLLITGAGTINGGSETGELAINEGVVDLESSHSSNLYFSASENTIKALRLNNVDEAVVAIRSPAIISEEIMLNGGELNANGNITLKSTAGKTAVIREITGGNVSGVVHVQRYFPADPMTYQFISSPVAGPKILDWQNYFTITGLFTGASTGAGLGTAPSVFVSGNGELLAYPLGTNASPFNTSDAPIEKAVGYQALIRNSVAFTLTQSGVPFQGDVEFKLDGSNPSESGLNLIGNPYASGIVWSNDPAQWEKHSVNAVISVPVYAGESTAKFSYYDASSGLAIGEALVNGEVASGAAFWVHAAGETPSLRIKEPAKLPDIYTVGPVSYLRLALKQNANTDEAIIIISPGATDGFDADIDGMKRYNIGMFSFASVTADENAAAINHVADDFCSKEIRLAIENVSPGSYTISAETLETLMGIQTITLKDNFNSSATNLRDFPAYTFTVTSDPASYGLDRFSLVLERSTLDLSAVVSHTVECGEPVRIMLTNTQAGATYVIVNEQEEEISNASVSTGSPLEFSLIASQLVEGSNTVKVKTYFEGCSSQLLPTNVIFDFYTPPTLSASDVQVCLGGSASIEATGGNFMMTYEWKQDQEVLSETSPVLVTGTVNEETFFSVRAITPSGCPGPEAHVAVTPITLEMPMISQDGDVLVANVQAEQYEWKRNGVVVQSSTADTFAPDRNGSYSVTAITGDCSQLSGEFVWTPIDEEGLAFSCSISPNPSRRGLVRLQINSPDASAVNVTIMDARAKTLFVHSYHIEKSNTIIINDEGISSGIFIVIVEQGLRKRVLRVMVE